MKNQTMKLEAINLFQILKSPRWMVMLFLLPMLMMVHFAMAAEPVVPAADKFDHAKIGFTLSGAHAQARCTACHINNVFKGTPRDCATCHTTGNHMGATAKPIKHITTNVQCDVCHKTTLWTPAFFSHIGIADGTCNTCHNNTAAKGKNPDSHMPTTQDCSDCHSTISFTTLKAGAVMSLPTRHFPTTQDCSTCHNSSAFVPGNMSHTGITGACETCHNGQTYLGTSSQAKPLPKPINHFTTVSLCETCHAANKTNPGDFTGAKMNHTNIVNNCSSCHSDGMSFAGVNPVKRKQDASKPHMTTSLDCSNCHSSTTSFVFSPTSTVMPLGHLPSNMPCSTCHSAGFGSGSGVMVHAGISTGCVSCHNGTTYSVGMTPLPKPSSTHLPTTAACEICHSPTSTTTGGFAGFGTTNKMNHAGISNNCVLCHSGTTTYAVGMLPVAKPAGVTGHVPTSMACETCHAFTAFTTFANTQMNHTGASDCASCHYNGANFTGIAQIKRMQDAVPTHPPTTATQNCSSCHTNTVTFKGAAGALPANHIPVTTQACSLCHVSGYGAGSGVMNHAGITTNCANCHDGQSFSAGTGITPKNKSSYATHMTTTQDCSVCHMQSTFVSFAGGTGGSTVPTGHFATAQPCSLCHIAGYGANSGVMNHSGITTKCADCHDGRSFPAGVGVTPKSKSSYATHMTTTQDCSSCHMPSTFVSFAGGTGGTVAPTGHIPLTTQACVQCHAGNNFGANSGVMSHSGITNNCKNCHDGLSYSAGVGVTPKNKSSFPTHMATTLDCSVCHMPSTFVSFAGGQGGTTLPSTGHFATTLPCATCHANGYSPTLTTMSHLGIVSDCARCHTGQVYFTLAVKAKSGLHVPTTAVVNGALCETCHTASNTASFTSFVATPAATTMKHTGILTGCANCHTGQVYASVTPTSKGLTHIPYAANLLGGATMDCQPCHSPTLTTAGSFMTKVNTNTLHNGSRGGPSSGLCIGCHAKGLTFSASMTHKTHNGASTTKDCSSSGCHAPVGGTGAAYSSWN